MKKKFNQKINCLTIVSNGVMIAMVLVSTIFFSCKKDKKNTIVAPANFSEIKFSDVQAKESAMNATIIVATNASGFVWQPNDVYVFKTSDSRFGKFQVVGIDAANNNKLTINATVYNTDGSLKLVNTLLAIRGTYSSDLDLLTESTYANGDFFWNRLTLANTEFSPTNGAKFAKYTF